MGWDEALVDHVSSIENLEDRRRQLEIGLANSNTRMTRTR
jgi:hypothetical protein